MKCVLFAFGMDTVAKWQLTTFVVTPPRYFSLSFLDTFWNPGFFTLFNFCSPAYVLCFIQFWIVALLVIHIDNDAYYWFIVILLVCDATSTVKPSTPDLLEIINCSKIQNFFHTCPVDIVKCLTSYFVLYKFCKIPKLYCSEKSLVRMGRCVTVHIFKGRVCCRRNQQRGTTFFLFKCNS